MSLLRRVVSTSDAVARALTAAGVAVSRSLVASGQRARILPVARPLPGERRSIPYRGGVVGFRYSAGTDPLLTPIVFVHGWGQCADSAWFAVLGKVSAPFVAIDLPGHGLSHCVEPFSFDLAATALLAVVDDLGWVSPRLVAFSLGGPVAFTAIRLTPDRFSEVFVVASTAYWQVPQISLYARTVSRAVSRYFPFSLANLVHDLRRIPAFYSQVSLSSLLHRPSLSALTASAACMRSFDARRWNDLRLPPCRWLIPDLDKVLPPRLQRRSARALGAQVVVVPKASHMFLLTDPSPLVALLDRQPKSDLGSVR